MDTTTRTLRVGSDDSHVIESRGRRELSPFQLATPVPLGVCHALPEDDAVALCGYRPLLVWPGNPWPGSTTPLLLCGFCDALARES